MIKWDGHTHSQFCRHGSGENTAEMVERAIQLGFERYSITEHAPLPPGIIDDPELAAEFTLLAHELPDYFAHLADIKRCYADRIEIFAGLEIDFIDGYQTYFDDFVAENLAHLDDLLVSVHMLKGRSGIAPIDFTPDTFESELVGYYGSAAEVHRVYWQQVQAMVSHPVKASVSKRIGHLGLINKYRKRFPVAYEEEEYNPVFEKLFAAIKSNHWDLDYNVAGLKKDLCHDIYISERMMAYCRQYAIPLIYGSDAHDVSSVGQFYDSYKSRLEIADLSH